MSIASRSAGGDLAERLRARRDEIEQSALSRALAIAPLSKTADPGYRDGLHKAVAAAIDYSLAGIELGKSTAPPVPDVLRAQARLAARSGVGLDKVFRRYFAGYALLGDAILQEAGVGDAPQRASRELARLFDRLLATIGDEYRGEEQELLRSSEQRRAERVKQLLAGELRDVSELAYDFDVWHLGLIVTGSGAQHAVKELREGTDCRALIVRRDEETVWAWLGAQQRIDPAKLLEAADRAAHTELRIAIGEPGEGMAGWRLSHRQAAAALPVAQRVASGIVRYAEVALLAGILGDEVLRASLRELYLVPLEGERDGGETLRETLRAYFAARGNVSSTAMALRVNRHTVTNRLRAVEERIARRIEDCTTEIEAALQLEGLGKAMVANSRQST